MSPNPPQDPKPDRPGRWISFDEELARVHMMAETMLRSQAQQNAVDQRADRWRNLFIGALFGILYALPPHRWPLDLVLGVVCVGPWLFNAFMAWRRERAWQHAANDPFKCDRPNCWIHDNKETPP